MASAGSARTPREIVDLIERAGLLAPGAPVVVMYSGGRDSTCLLDLAVRIAGREAVSVLHVNYGLRGDADADEHHCRERCDRLGVALEVRRPRRPGTAAGLQGEPGGELQREPAGDLHRKAGDLPGQPIVGNLQAWARDARYGAAAQLALARGGDVAAGHTATDQVETILYRLASSPSRRALLGMRPRDGLLIRPLLAIAREQTTAYCEQRGLGWREDQTNASSTFARGRIRAGLVEALREVHPGAQENVLALAEILRCEAEVLDGLVEEAIGGRGEIELTRLRELPVALRRLVVQRLADDALGGPAPGAARRAGEVAALADRGTAALDLPHGVRAHAEHGVLRFGRTPPIGANPQVADRNEVADRNATAASGRDSPPPPATRMPHNQARASAPIK